jgi:hypothetical protein
MRPACADRGCQPEEKWYALTGRVVDAKVEADGDIHLALQDADGKNAGTVSAEIPVGPKWCEIRQIVFGWTKQKFPFTVNRTPRTQEQAIDYPQGRACFRSGEIRILDSSGQIKRIIPLNEADRKL